MSSPQVREKLERAARAAAALQRYYNDLQAESDQRAPPEAKKRERPPTRRASSSKYKLGIAVCFGTFLAAVSVHLSNSGFKHAFVDDYLIGQNDRYRPASDVVDTCEAGFDGSFRAQPESETLGKSSDITVTYEDAYYDDYMDDDEDTSHIDGHCDTCHGTDDIELETLLSYVEQYTGHLSDEDLKDISFDDIFSGRFEDMLAAKQLPVTNPAFAAGKGNAALAEAPAAAAAAAAADEGFPAKDAIWEEPHQAAPEASDVPKTLDAYRLSPGVELLLRALLPLGCMATLVCLVFLVGDMTGHEMRLRNSVGFHEKVQVGFGVLNNKPLNDLSLWLYVYYDEGLTATCLAMAMVAVATNLPKSWFGGRLKVSLAYNFSNHYIGMKHLLMMLWCPELLAQRLAAFTALSALYHVCQISLIDTAYTHFYFYGLDITQLSLAHKLASEVGTGLGIDLWATVLSFQHVTIGTFLYGLWSFAVSPPAWLGCSKAGIHFIFTAPIQSLWRLSRSKEFWAYNYLASVLGGCVTRMMISAQLSDEYMPDVVKQSLKEKLQLSVARSNDVQHHWALTKAQDIAWRLCMSCWLHRLTRLGEHQAADEVFEKFRRRVDSSSAGYGWYSHLNTDVVMEYIFVGILGPWFKLVRIEPHKAKSWGCFLLRWACYLLCLPVIVTSTISYCFWYFRSEGFNTVYSCLAFLVLVWKLVAEASSKCGAAIGSVIGAGFECVAITVIQICEVNIVQQTLQVTLLPIVQLISTSSGWVSRVASALLWKLIALAANGTGQVKRTLGANRSHSRKKWDQDVSEVLSKAQDAKGMGKQKAKRPSKQKAAQQQKTKPAGFSTVSSDADNCQTDAIRAASGATKHAEPKSQSRLPVSHQEGIIPGNEQSAARVGTKQPASTVDSAVSGYAKGPDSTPPAPPSDPTRGPQPVAQQPKAAETARTGKQRRKQNKAASQAKPVSTPPSGSSNKQVPAVANTICKTAQTVCPPSGAVKTNAAVPTSAALKASGVVAAAAAFKPSVAKPAADLATPREEQTKAEPVTPQLRLPQLHASPIGSDQLASSLASVTPRSPPHAAQPPMQGPSTPADPQSGPPATPADPKPAPSKPPVTPADPKLDAHHLTATPTSPKPTPQASHSDPKPTLPKPKHTGPVAHNDPLAFLLGQPAYSPNSGHVNQPVLKPAALPVLAPKNAHNSTDAPNSSKSAGSSASTVAAASVPASVDAESSGSGASEATASMLPSMSGGFGLRSVSDEECIVCWNAKRATVLAPCGHQALCRGCTLDLLARQDAYGECLCPICRKQVVSYIERVYAA